MRRPRSLQGLVMMWYNIKKPIRKQKENYSLTLLVRSCQLYKNTYASRQWYLMWCHVGFLSHASPCQDSILKHAHGVFPHPSRHTSLWLSTSHSGHLTCYTSCTVRSFSLYTYSNIRQIKTSRLRWAGHVARMGEEIKLYTVWVGSPKERDHSIDRGVNRRIGSEWILGRLVGGCGVDSIGSD
jgi:hypothetical protein